MIYFMLVFLCYTLIDVQTTDLHDEKVFSCKNNITNLNSERVNLTEYCKEKACIPKCCGQNEVLRVLGQHKIVCTSILDLKDAGSLLDYPNLKIYNSDINSKIQLSTKDVNKDFTFVQNKALLKEKCGHIWGINLNGYILDNGNFAGDLRTIQANEWQILDTASYCVERVLKRKKNSTTYTNIFVYFVAQDEEEDQSKEIVLAAPLMLISSFFLFLVLLVYCVVPKLRNLSGMLLMAYITTQLLEFVFHSTRLILPNLHYKTCEIISPIQYFLRLSTFTWLNIMSFDIWWTFRGMRLRRAINRQGEVVKFFWYALYACGIAAVMTIGAVLIDKARWPNLIRPAFDACFHAEKANLHYLYTPIGILTLVNIVLFMMTFYNIWVIQKILKDFNNSSSNKKNQNRFRLYIKMSLVMGISWALEVSQAIYELSPWQFNVINFYNESIGVIIFLLFIFNRTTLVMLHKRFNIKWKPIQGMVKSSTNTRTQSSNSKEPDTKAKSTEESDIEIFDSDVTIGKKNINIMEQPV